MDRLAIPSPEERKHHHCRQDGDRNDNPRIPIGCQNNHITTDGILRRKRPASPSAIPDQSRPKFLHIPKRPGQHSVVGTPSRQHRRLRHTPSERGRPDDHIEQWKCRHRHDQPDRKTGCRRNGNTRLPSSRPTGHKHRRRRDPASRRREQWRIPDRQLRRQRKDTHTRIRKNIPSARRRDLRRRAHTIHQRRDQIPRRDSTEHRSSRRILAATWRHDTRHSRKELFPRH